MDAAMARYKHIDTSPRFLAVDLERQLIPGSFEHALNHLLDHEMDLSGLDARYCNDATGAAAYPPAMLLKIILFAYAQGIVSSRDIERACREQITFIALSGDSQPHFTTIAGFVSSLGDDIARIFSQVLYICDRQGLIGREMFAIDGVKLPSNAAKAKSGTRAATSNARRRNSKPPPTPCWHATAQKTASRLSLGYKPKKRNALPVCNKMPPSSANGLPPTQKIAREVRAPPAKATAPTTTPPRWPPAKVSSRATPAWLR